VQLISVEMQRSAGSTTVDYKHHTYSGGWPSCQWHLCCHGRLSLGRDGQDAGSLAGVLQVLAVAGDGLGPLEVLGHLLAPEVSLEEV
jgi:hypothetical protein